MKTSTKDMTSDMALICTINEMEEAREHEDTWDMLDEQALFFLKELLRTRQMLSGISRTVCEHSDEISLMKDRMQDSRRLLIHREIIEE